MATSARPTAPAQIDQRAVPVPVSSPLCARCSSTTLSAQMPPTRASIAATAPGQPSIPIKDTPLRVRGRPAQKSQCAVAQTLPATKKTRTSIMRLDPPPAVKSVPDAQPDPSCMPTPKTNAPNAEATPIGSTLPRTSRPNAPPIAIRG